MKLRYDIFVFYAHGKLKERNFGIMDQEFIFFIFFLNDRIQ